MSQPYRPAHSSDFNRSKQPGHTQHTRTQRPTTAENFQPFPPQDLHYTQYKKTKVFPFGIIATVLAPFNFIVGLIATQSLNPLSSTFYFLIIVALVAASFLVNKKPKDHQEAAWKRNLRILDKVAAVLALVIVVVVPVAFMIWAYIELEKSYS